jgi:hypothetical protein
MESEERPDWVDRVLARESLWEPPPRFADRLVVQAMQGFPPRRSTSRRVLPELVLGACQSLAAHVDVSLWVLRQYRSLLFS